MATIKKVVAIAAFIWAVVLSAVALMLPPSGVIDSSVLILIAQILVLVATILGFNIPTFFNHGNDSSKEVAAR